MLGFHARARTREIRVDSHELEAARGSSALSPAHQDDDHFRLPRKDSIARRLIEEWLKSP